MNILIVDDQKNVIDGLVKGVRWEMLMVHQLFTAEDAQSAKEILKNNRVDIMLSDIEMPGESGIELFRWVREHDDRIECIFLTSHADFAFAKEALKLGSFDYILQPAPYHEIEEAIIKVRRRMYEKEEILQFSAYGKEVYRSKDQILEGTLKAWLGGAGSEENTVLDTLRKFQICLTEETECVYGILQVFRYRGTKGRLEANLFRYVITNILAELFEQDHIQVINAALEEEKYAFLLYKGQECENNRLSSGIISQKLDVFLDKIREYYGCIGACYISDSGRLKYLKKKISKVQEMLRGNVGMQARVFADRSDSFDGKRIEKVPGTDRVGTEEDSYVETVIQYIHCNIEKDIRRSDLAGIVNLNEDYLSRLFKKEKGMSLKEYILLEKMRTAQNLLKNTNFSISMISAKVGFDNFSHFSQTYKKVMKKTPMEERSDRN